MPSTNPISELFRFVSLRPPTKLNTINLPAGYTSYDVLFAAGSSDISVAESEGDLFYRTIKATVDANGTRETLNAQAVTFKGLSTYIGSKKALYQKFVGFDLIEEWLKINHSSKTVAQTITYIESAIGSTITTLLDASAFKKAYWRAWDSLFAQLIAPSDLSLREEYYSVIKLSELIRKIHAATDTTVQLDTLFNWDTEKLVLPDKVFPLPVIQQTTTLANGPSPSVPTDVQTARDEITAHLAAKNDLLNGYAAQRLEVKLSTQYPTVTLDAYNIPLSNPSSASNTIVLKSDQYTGLASDTKTILTGLGFGSTTTHVGDAVHALEVKVNDLSKVAYNVPNADFAVVIGGVVVPYSTVCTQLQNNGFDSCGHYTGGSLPTAPGAVNNITIGDLKIVKKELLKYEAGDVAHVENVLATETREHFTRRLDSTTTSTTTDTQTTVLQERDLQTTDQFSLEQQTAEQAQKTAQTNTGVNVSGGYGPVSMSANFNYATSNSQSKADSIATATAKTVVDKAVTSIVQSTRQIRQTIVTTEVEDVNKHSFTNTGTGATNISGIYRWLDKWYLCTLMNYGKRIMLEFMVPEPAAFYIYSQLNSATQDVKITKPIAPKDAGLGKLASYEDVTEYNFGKWAALYDAQDVVPPPPKFKYLGKTIHQDAVPNVEYSMQSFNDLVVPDGYEAVGAKTFNGADFFGDLRVAVGSVYIQGNSTKNHQEYNIHLDNLTGVIPVSIFAIKSKYYHFNIEVQCMLSQDSLNQWKMKTFNSIMNAYNNKLDAYNSDVQNAKFEQEVKGKNPTLNRQAEQTELKKRCIEIMTAQRFESFDAMQNNQGTLGYPEMDFNEASAQGNFIRFFEESFEWENMTYTLYPYFWGKKPNWLTTLQFNDDDVLFSNFLQSGSAKVVVPVNPAYNSAILQYLKSGEIWKGENVPATLQNISLMDEMSNADAVVEGERWAVKVPTTFIYLEGSSTLPDNSVALDWP